MQEAGAEGGQLVSNSTTHDDGRRRGSYTITVRSKKAQPHSPDRRAAAAANDPSSMWVRSVYGALLHGVTLAIYLLPLLGDDTVPRDHAVLDELHLVGKNVANRDVIDSNWLELFQHDYWGRPMDAPNSHQSWRPLAVLLLRLFSNQTLAVHRLISVVTHAAAAELVGILAVKLLGGRRGSQSQRFDDTLLRCLAKLAFALHPTHVEVTANVANRPHLLALVGSLVASDPDTPWAVFVLAIAAGFLCCETFLFQVGPAAVTVWAVAYVRRYHQQQQPPRGDNGSSSIVSPSAVDGIVPTRRVFAPRVFGAVGGGVLRRALVL